MKYFNIKLTGVLFASGFILLSCAEMKHAGKDIGHATRDVTRAIGHGTRDVTRDIGHGTRDAVKAIGAEAKRITRPKSKQ